MKRYSIKITSNSDGGIRCNESDEGEWVLNEDLISELRNIFKKWPGIYPEKPGAYYFKYEDGRETVNEIRCLDELFLYKNITKPEQWGPEVPKWREV